MGRPLKHLRSISEHVLSNNLITWISNFKQAACSAAKPRMISVALTERVPFGWGFLHTAFSSSSSSSGLWLALFANQTSPSSNAVESGIKRRVPAVQYGTRDTKGSNKRHDAKRSMMQSRLGGGEAGGESRQSRVVDPLPAPRAHASRPILSSTPGRRHAIPQLFRRATLSPLALLFFHGLLVYDALDKRADLLGEHLPYPEVGPRSTEGKSLDHCVEAVGGGSDDLKSPVHQTGGREGGGG